MDPQAYDRNIPTWFLVFLYFILRVPCVGMAIRFPSYASGHEGLQSLFYRMVQNFAA